MAQILIIDDDPDLRSIMQRVLERAGHTVQSAADGEAGLRLFRQTRPALVITDLIMPEKEGIETILELRDEAPEVRILAMSGGGVVDPGGPLSDAELFGADGSLAKPFSIDELQAVVERVLAQRV